MLNVLSAIVDWTHRSVYIVKTITARVILNGLNLETEVNIKQSLTHASELLYKVLLY